MTRAFLILPFLAVAACQPEPCCAQPEAPGLTWSLLPVATSNNAVATARIDGQTLAYSFAGLHAGKTWQDVTADAYACDLAARDCTQISGLPDGIGRLASVAATVNNQIYIFGGYTVAEDGSEASTPEVWRFAPSDQSYHRVADLPTPVDDAVALVYQDRYVYLVSGWHDTDNVDLVQVYDSAEDRWFDATPWPGQPVFGHAGGIVENELLVCGGVQIIPPAQEGARRSFARYDACWGGTIDANNPGQISWYRAENMPGPAGYRAAATGSSRLGEIVFVGGTDNPYNITGIGYDGVPSDALPHIYRWSVAERSWQISPYPAFAPTMDHRNLVEWNNAFFTLGGMTAGQDVTREIRRIDLD